MALTANEWIGVLAGCFLALGGSPAFADAGGGGTEAQGVSPIKADAQRGTLKVDERVSASASPPAAATGIVTEPSSASSANTVPMVAWLPSGMPTEGVALSSRYGWRIHPIHGDPRMHRGIDIPGTPGSPVYATAEGAIALADWSGDYGLLVEIDHGAGLDTRYAHLSSLAVTPGQRVRKGQVVGYVGSTGSSTGPHLHYEVRMAGEAVDPTAFLVPDGSQPASAAPAKSGAHGGD